MGARERLGIASAVLLCAAAVARCTPPPSTEDRSSLEPDDGGEGGGRHLSVDVVHRDAEHQLLAVDPAGTMYGLAFATGGRQLWASEDRGRTWERRGTLPTGISFRRMSVLSDGTLLCDTLRSSGHVLVRSTDHGATWRDVLDTGAHYALQPHSIVELRGTAYYGEYQVGAREADVRLWASEDRGATWRVRYVFRGHRHVHGLVADPATGTLWALMGDSNGAVLRSRDDGRSWQLVLGPPGGVAVDAVVTRRGLLFGRDALFAPAVPGIVRIGHDDVATYVGALPGPSYSILAPSGGGYLMSVSREVDGDVYAPGDLSAHLLGSADGDQWEELLEFPRLSSLRYTHSNVYWQLPTGEVVLELVNVSDFGERGDGYWLLDVEVR